MTGYIFTYLLMPEREQTICWDQTWAACVASDRVIHYSMSLWPKVPDVSLLRFTLIKIYFIYQNDTFFIYLAIFGRKVFFNKAKKAPRKH